MVGGGVLTYDEPTRNLRLAVRRKDIARLTAADVAALLPDREKVCLKPSVDTCSGVGVTLFRREGGIFTSGDGARLDGNYLMGLGADWVVQEVIAQHPYMSQFNPSSVNTLRLCTYRSVVDEKVRVTGSIVRIGADGAFCDNAHAGGRFVGIDVESGRLHATTIDTEGTHLDTWNGVDFSKTTFEIPYWQGVKALAESVAARVVHSRLLAFDICLDAQSRPRMVELNNGCFSWWLFLNIGQDVFAGETRDVIAYCLEREREEKRCVRVM